MAIAHELLDDALEARRADVLRIFEEGDNTSIAIVLHMKHGLGIAAHAFPPAQRQTDRPSIIRRRRT